MHPNSVQAYWEGSIELFGKRHKQVIQTLRACRVPMTDREVMTACGFADPNQVRPRLTELVEAGIVEEVGTTICPITHKTVRLAKLAKREVQAEFDLGDVLTPRVMQTINRKAS